MTTIPCPCCGTPIPLVIAGTVVKGKGGTLVLRCTNLSCRLSR